MLKTQDQVLTLTLGQCADELYALRERKSKLNKQVDELEGLERALRERLINELPKSDADGVVGRKAKAVVTTKKVATVKDWDALYKHVARTKSFDLLQRRVSDAAVKARWDDQKQVPGVEAFTVVSVSITKR